MTIAGSTALSTGANREGDAAVLAVPAPRRIPAAAPYVLVSSVVGLALFASVTPSPLYETYAQLWHFSALSLTLVYATYAFGVLLSLLLVGGASDQVGRRPVLLASLGVLIVAAVLYMLADSIAWLFVARALQGLATGAALSTASASMLDFHPRRDPSRVGIMNGVMSATGIAAGRPHLGGAGAGRYGTPGAALRGAGHPVRLRLRRRRSDSRAGDIPQPASPHSRQATRPKGGAGTVRPRRTGRPRIMVDRRPDVLAGPAAVRPVVPFHKHGDLRPGDRDAGRRRRIVKHSLQAIRPALRRRARVRVARHRHGTDRPGRGLGLFRLLRRQRSLGLGQPLLAQEPNHADVPSRAIFLVNLDSWEVKGLASSRTFTISLTAWVQSETAIPCVPSAL